MLDVMSTEQVWTELHAGIRAFVRRRVRNPADADDIVQRVFLQVHRGLGDLQDGERLHGWIYRTARNAIIDHYRAAAPRREIASGDAADLADAEGSPLLGEPDDNEHAALTELAHCVEPLLRQLPAHDSEALRLTDIDGLTQVEAARRLSLSVSGMKSRVQRARLRLKVVFEECCRLQLDTRGGIIDYEQRQGDACRPRACAADAQGCQRPPTARETA
jgi:RNA polymerase sigma-70 factor (ECF subfamily)